MSLDIYLQAPSSCPHCGKELVFGGQELFSANFTHNVTNMWRKAGVYDALYMSEGKRAGDYIQALNNGVQEISENYAEYQQLDSPNGWGTVLHALPWLKKVRDAFVQNPDAEIHISK